MPLEREKEREGVLLAKRADNLEETRKGGTVRLTY